MTNRQNILLVFGTRPEAIKLAPVALALAADARFRVSICSTGQHRDMVWSVCDLFGLQVDHDLDLMVSGQTIDHVTTATLSRLAQVFARTTPNTVIVHGDTSTAFAAALSAFFHNIRITHVEAGLRTHDIRTPGPEEGDRALLSRIADFHFAPTIEARANLERENVGGEIVVTGNTVVDAAQIAAKRIAVAPGRLGDGRRLLRRAGLCRDRRDQPLYFLTHCGPLLEATRRNYVLTRRSDAPGAFSSAGPDRRPQISR